MFIHEMFTDPVPHSHRVPSGLVRTPTPVPTREEGTYRPKKGLAKFSLASSTTSTSDGGFGPIYSSAVEGDADAVVRVHDAQFGGRNGPAKLLQQQSEPTTSPFAAAAAQDWCTCQQGDQSSCKQHPRKPSSSKTKAKLKAIGMFFAKGLSWSATARPALPVPIYPPVVC